MDVVSTVSEIVNGDVVKKAYDIAFPNLGIFIETLKNNIRIGNFTIAYYGIIIAIGMLLSLFVVSKIAKKNGIDEDNIYDLFIIIIICGIVGARTYYVIFNWDYYSIRPYEILDIRAGGLAVFGGIILSCIGIAIYCKIKKCNLIKILDVVVSAVPLGQAIGRYGNFFNMEAFGGYTNNLLAMRMNMKYIDKSVLDLEQTLNIIEENGAQYVQAHPTFFYESTANIVLFIILINLFKSKKRFDGQIFATYLIGYGIIRFFVETLRTDSLMLYNMKVSKLVAVICIIIGIVMYVFNTVIKNKIAIKKK